MTRWGKYVPRLRISIPQFDPAATTPSRETPSARFSSGTSSRTSGLSKRVPARASRDYAGRIRRGSTRANPTAALNGGAYDYQQCGINTTLAASFEVRQHSVRTIHGSASFKSRLASCMETTHSRPSAGIGGAERPGLQTQQRWRPMDEVASYNGFIDPKTCESDRISHTAGGFSQLSATS